MNRSTIFNTMYKGRMAEFHQYMNQIVPYGISYTSSNTDNTLISYYEENDHYDSHYDTFAWTACIWMVREPRLFDGGDFEFPQSGHQVKLKNNRAVFFPCCYLHKVTPVKFHTQPKDIGYGRYTITHFYYHIPKSKIDRS